jgi:hypothetical protein
VIAGRAPSALGGSVPVMHLDEQTLSSPALMRVAVVESLVQQGFRVRGGQIVAPDMGSKDELRALHRQAVEHQRERSKAGLYRYEDRLLRMVANGSELQPTEIRPRLVLVSPDSEEELLFRWARLHWSIPTSAGYGRRLRFLVMDEAHDRLMGIIGLADPVFGLGGRDRWVGWDSATRRERLDQVMDAFVLGAIPPYNQLLAGKLIAMLTTSAEVQTAYRERYCGVASVINGRDRREPLAMITTASALGRSSVYNRLRMGERKVAISVGFTMGSGDFQFANGLYDDLTAYAKLHCTPTAKHGKWGTGFRNRREVVKKALRHLGLGEALLYHGVRREVFVFPVGENTAAALAHGERLRPYTDTVTEIADFWRERWMLRRAVRHEDYKSFRRESWRLWP